MKAKAIVSSHLHTLTLEPQIVKFISSSFAEHRRVSFEAINPIFCHPTLPITDDQHYKEEKRCPLSLDQKVPN